jgi:hypothetical protein
MSKSPEATFRFGNVSSSVFVQETNGDGNQKRKFRTINVQKSYKDGDETKFGNSFTLGDMPSAIRAMQLAQSHVEAKEAEVTA